VKITTVRYRKLVPGPGYENKAVEAEVMVDPGQTPEDALLLLVDWVTAQMNGGATTDLATLRQEVGICNLYLGIAIEHVREFRIESSQVAT
jgi:hypothetical protein